jgi:hypothetical protein
MSISRKNKKLSERRTQNYNQVLQSLGTTAETPVAIASAGGNILLIKPDLLATVTVGAGSTVAFLVGVTAINSDAAVTYQWQTSADGTTWTNVVGETTNVYSRAVSAGDNNLRVRVLVSQLLRTAPSAVCQVTVLPAASSVFGLDGPASVKVGAAYLSGLFLDVPLDPMNVTQQRLATLTILTLFSDPWVAVGGASTKIANSNLNVLFSQPNDVENVVTYIANSNLNVLLSNELDAAGIFGATDNERIFTFAGRTISNLVAGPSVANYTYTASNLPQGLSMTAAGLITGAVISDTTFDQTATITATHKTTSQLSSISLLFSHAQLSP